MATGGSRHRFKFLTLHGERIVDVMDQTDLDGIESGGSNGLWTSKWAWPMRSVEDEVWCNDGSRSGGIGNELVEAIANGGK